MARRLRVQFAGAIYHVLSRGDRREPIFQDDADRGSFLDILARTCTKTQWQVHAYCLMRNHFHLVVETPQPNLVAGMRWYLGTYTMRFNRRHKLSGHLFSGRYKSLLVCNEGGYLRSVCDYVHLNPVRAGLLRPDQPVSSYRWSSYPLYVGPPSRRPPWLRVDRVLGEAGIPRDSPAGRREFERRLEQRRTEDLQEESKSIRRGWCLGSDQFRRELLEQVTRQIGGYPYGPELLESSEKRAERIVAEELRRLGWKEADLDQRRKGDPGKLEIVRRLRTETPMPLQWMADRLRMGTRTHLAHLLYWEGKPRPWRKKG